MAINNSLNLYTNNFSVAGQWQFSNSNFKFTSLPTAVTNSIVYYNTSSNALSIGAVPVPGVVSMINTYVTSGTSFSVNPKTLFAIIELWGGGGGGGSVSVSGSASSVAGGGGGGGYIRQYFLKSALGSSFTYSIGLGGDAGTAGGTGGTGGDTTTSLGVSATGAAGGSGGANGTAVSAGGLGGSGVATDFISLGQRGGIGLIYGSPASVPVGGYGGASVNSEGGTYFNILAPGSGFQGLTPNSGFGAGGSGAAANTTSGTFVGGAGANGLMIVHEYLSA